MKLIELSPRFLRYETRVEEYQRRRDDGHMSDPAHVHTDACWETVTGPRIFYPWVDRIDDAQGVSFLCPKCFAANKGPVGTHSVICWSSSRGVPDDAHPKPGRWCLVGTGYHDLSLMEEPGKSRSVLLLGGCAWHGFVTNGEVT